MISLSQVRVAGRYVTLLLDPHSYDAVINDSGSLDFSPYAQVLMRRIFNLELPLQQPAKAKAMMTRYHVTVQNHFVVIFNVTSCVGETLALLVTLRDFPFDCFVLFLFLYLRVFVLMSSAVIYRCFVN